MSKEHRIRVTRVRTELHVDLSVQARRDTAAQHDSADQEPSDDAKRESE
jgi:hypothetical protein